ASYALALAVAFFVVATGAFAANSPMIGAAANRVGALASEVASGFKETFSSVAAFDITNSDNIADIVATYPARITARSEATTPSITPTVLARIDLSPLQMPIGVAP